MNGNIYAEILSFLQSLKSVPISNFVIYSYFHEYAWALNMIGWI